MGAAHVGAQQLGAGAQQQLLCFFMCFRRPLNQSFIDFLCLPQQGLQVLQQLGAGAQQDGAQAAGAAHAGAQAAGAAQVGAQAAGAAQVGAHAAGAAHDGAGAQQLGAGAQQLFLLRNMPASALFRPAKHTRAAVIQANFMGTFSSDFQMVGEREARTDSPANTLPAEPDRRTQPRGRHHLP